MFKIRNLSLLLCLLLMAIAAHAADLRIKIPPTPDMALVAEHPDKGFLRVFSTVSTELEFKCYGGCVEVRRKGGGEYLLVLYKGEKNIVVKAVGYSPVTVTLPHEIQEKETFRVDIEGEDFASSKGKGNLVLNSIPEGARVIVEGLPEGEYTTPHTFKKVAAMTYQVTLIRDRCKPADFKFQVLPDQDNVKNVELVRNWFDLRFESTVPDARVTLNGKGFAFLKNFVGEQDGLDFGEYGYRIESDDFEPMTGQVSAQSYKDTLLRYAPKFRVGYLQIHSADPSLPLQVYANGSPIGTTPVQLRSPIGVQRLELKSPYCADSILEYNLVKYRDTLVVQPRRQFGLLSVQTDPQVEILLDGNKLGSGVVTGHKTAVGPHQLKYMGNSKVLYAQDFNLNQNELALKYSAVEHLAELQRAKAQRKKYYRWSAAGAGALGIYMAAYGYLSASDARAKYEYSWQASEINSNYSQIQSGNTVSSLGIGLICVGAGLLSYTWVF